MGDWYRLLPPPWAVISLAFVAVVCGGIVGAERQRKEKPAGFRTMMLVCLGATIFTMTGFAFTSASGDSGRVAAQIVTGIGFLGAGVIMHGRGTIGGVTTAATIWVTAAIGMLTATGYACPALGASLLVRTVLLGVQQLEIHRLGGLAATVVGIDYLSDGGKTRVRIECVLVEYLEGAIVTKWSTVDKDHSRLDLQLQLPRHHLAELLGELADIPQVISIQQPV
jgi:putative Mg2+ transporter-C (MgtC) family protein